MTWMIHKPAYDTQSTHYERLSVLESLSDVEVCAKLQVTAEKLAEADKQVVRAQELRVKNGIARIPVRGVLLDQPNRFFTMFGIPHADYQTITKQVQAADADPDVDSVVLEVDSPGGLTKGMFECADALHASSKPLTASVSNMCASAAFMIASQADSISASSRADMVGSVGVVVAMRTSDRIVEITNTDSPNKRPDVKTEAGRAAVRATLDDIFGLAVDIMARGRNVSPDRVRTDFGQGAILIAPKALQAGMIDSLQAPSGQSTTPRAILADMGMDVKELKSSHTDAYEAAVDIGAAAERSRVDRLLKAGQKYGAMDLALEKIASGAEADGTAIFDFTMAAEGKTQSEQRVQANAADTGANVATTEDGKVQSESRIVRQALALGGLSPSWIPAQGA